MDVGLNRWSPFKRSALIMTSRSGGSLPIIPMTNHGDPAQLIIVESTAYRHAVSESVAMYVVPWEMI